MSQTIDRNRRMLAMLIYNLRGFTEDELIAEFRLLTHGDMSIGGGQNVQEYLDNLTEIGRLRKDRHSYKVVVS